TPRERAMGPPLLLQVDLQLPRPSIVFLGGRRSGPTSGKLAPVSPGVRRVLILVAAALVARGALHWATFSLPVSNDDAILLLMGRAVLHGELATTLWNQPNNGALDAYLLAP